MAEKTYTITLSEEFINRIAVGLGEIQTKFGAPVLEELNRQILAAQAQEAAAIETAQKCKVELDAHIAAAAQQAMEEVCNTQE